jgi:hypothetical protein
MRYHDAVLQRGRVVAWSAMFFAVMASHLRRRLSRPNAH